MSERITAIELPHDSAEQSAASVRYVDLYQSTGKIYTRRVRGFFQQVRRLINWPLMLAFFLLPWANIEGRQAVLLDLSSQRFHILGQTFWPQDGILLAWVLILAAFFLFALTVWAGRVWCGFSCPHTVWTLLFGWIEDKCEGDRNQRIRLDQQPWDVKKLSKKTLKHSLWALLSLLTGATFIGYFYGIRLMFEDFLALQVSLEALFWVGLFAGFTYLNAGFLREQFCQYMCPYSRIQSVMFDSESLLVEYDAERGQHQESGAGDCVNCDWCVQVCPAGIDIRDGLQAECINCGLCVDACDNVMDKLDRPRGLIRYAAQVGEHLGFARRLLRPRMLGYLTALTLMVGYFIFSVVTWAPLTLDVTRDRGTHLFRHSNGHVDNVYTLKLNYKGDAADSFRVSVSGDGDYRILGRTKVMLEGGESFALPLRVRVSESKVAGTAATIYFRVVSDTDDSIIGEQRASFIGPAVRR